MKPGCSRMWSATLSQNAKASSSLPSGTSNILMSVTGTLLLLETGEPGWKYRVLCKETENPAWIIKKVYSIVIVG